MTTSPPLAPPPDAAYFEPTDDRRVGDVEVEWFHPTAYARGPWSPDALHGGPAAAVLARALERAFPTIRLARLTADLIRPVPMAGFGIVAEVLRPGRLIATTRAQLVDATGTVCAIANGLHVATSEQPVLPGPQDNSAIAWPRLADAAPGDFPFGSAHDGGSWFSRSLAVRYPDGEGPEPGATWLWMRTIAIVAGEQPTASQRVCPLADCSNAFSRHGEPGPDGVSFINPDLTVTLHRDPIGEWFGMRSTSQWQPTGVGLATSQLFDDDGPVGLATQTLLLRPLPAG